MGFDWEEILGENGDLDDLYEDLVSRASKQELSDEELRMLDEPRERRQSFTAESDDARNDRPTTASIGSTLSVHVTKGDDLPDGAEGVATVDLDDAFRITDILVKEDSESDELIAIMPGFTSKWEGKDGRRPFVSYCEFANKSDDSAFRKAARKALEQGISVSVDAIGQDDIPFCGEYEADISLADNPNGNIKGYATVMVHDVLVIRYIRIIQGKYGLFLGMPSYRTSGDDTKEAPAYREVCRPKDKKERDAMTAAVLHAYERQLACQNEDAGIGGNDDEDDTYTFDAD